MVVHEPLESPSDIADLSNRITHLAGAAKPEYLPSSNGFDVATKELTAKSCLDPATNFEQWWYQPPTVDVYAGFVVDCDAVRTKHMLEKPQLPQGWSTVERTFEIAYSPSFAAGPQTWTPTSSIPPSRNPSNPINLSRHALNPNPKFTLYLNAKPQALSPKP